MLGQAPGAFGWDNEFPQHRCTVDGFEIARYKLTNGEYLRFVAAGGHRAALLAISATARGGCAACSTRCRCRSTRRCT